MLFAETIDPVYRSEDNELFLIRIEAKPLPNNPEFRELAGAYVNAWVDAATLREAEARCIAAIEEEGWSPICLEHWQLVCRDCYTGEAESPEEAEELAQTLAMVDEAFSKGISIAFYTWPRRKNRRRLPM